MSSLSSLKALFLIVRRSLRHHAVSTGITVLSTALASGLVMAVFAVSQQSREAFAGTQAGFDAVVGGRGNPIQLVLNTVFHLETSPGNIPWSVYQSLENDPRVQLAVPYAVGDNYYNYRIVGTTPEIFTEFEYEKGERFKIREPGKQGGFNPNNREAVIGSYVAADLGLKLGDTIQAYHGFTFDPSMKHEGDYKVVGILEPTNSPSDRVIWIPIEGIWRMPGHVGRNESGEEREFSGTSEAIPDEFKEISAVMLKFKSPSAGNLLSHQINNQGKVATMAWPIQFHILKLFDKIGWFADVLELVAYLVVVVAAASILASIYNTMNERRREFAILRALGARRWMVFSAIVLEAGAISALGALIGYAVYFAILGAAAGVIYDQTGVVIDLMAYHPALEQTPLWMIGLGLIAGILPALKAYTTEVARNLVANV